MWRVALGCLVVMGACATPHGQSEPAQQMAPFSAANGMSAVSSYSSGSDVYSDVEYVSKGKGLSVPHRERPTDGVVLVVRPDLLTAEFAVREVRPTSDAALEAAKASAAAVTAALAQATGNTSTTKLRGMTITKVIRNKQPIGVAVTVDGALEVPLPKELDFWARQRLYVAVLEATARLADSSHTQEEPLRAVSFENPEPGLKDPEAFRAELTDRWVARARAFASAAQSKDAPLSLVDCVPPAAITQLRQSLEEITLQLAVTCRLDAHGQPHSR
jgi:Protein of unknown function (DUF541)